MGSEETLDDATTATTWKTSTVLDTIEEGRLQHTDDNATTTTTTFTATTTITIQGNTSIPVRLPDTRNSDIHLPRWLDGFRPSTRWGGEPDACVDVFVIILVVVGLAIAIPTGLALRRQDHG